MFDTYAASFQINGTNFQPAGITGNQSIGSLVTTIITVLTAVCGIIAIFFIIIGGIRIVTASGDMKKIQAAQSSITYAIIGLAVTALAFVILQIVGYFLGAKTGIF